MLIDELNAITHGMRALRQAYVAQISRIDILLLNAQGLEDQILQLQNSATGQTQREVSRAELKRSGIPVLGVQQGRSS